MSRALLLNQQNKKLVRPMRNLIFSTVFLAASLPLQRICILPLLPVGAYTLSVEAAGLRPYVRTGIILSVKQEAMLDITVEVGDIAESVKVTGEALLLNTRSSEVTALIDPVRITELPLNGCNPLELAGLLPGVQGVVAPEFAIDTNSGPRLSVDGSRQNQNAMLFDGARRRA